SSRWGRCRAPADTCQRVFHRDCWWIIAQPLLLPPSLDIEIPFLAPDIQCALTFERVPVDHELVLDMELVIPHHTLSRERQFPFLQFQVLEIRILLVRPTHSARKPVTVLLDRQGGCPLLVADIVLTLPRSNRV